MSKGITVKRQFGVCYKRCSQPKVGVDRAKPPSQDRVPRISRLMALAIRFDQLIRDSVVADQAELARLGHVSRARLTQIMDLLNLAPDIQESLLGLPSSQDGRDAISERQLRPIVVKPNWRKQQLQWIRLLAIGN